MTKMNNENLKGRLELLEENERLRGELGRCGQISGSFGSSCLTKDDILGLLMEDTKKEEDSSGKSKSKTALEISRSEYNYENENYDNHLDDDIYVYSDPDEVNNDQKKNCSCDKYKSQMFLDFEISVSDPYPIRIRSVSDPFKENK